MKLLHRLILTKLCNKFENNKLAYEMTVRMSDLSKTVFKWRCFFYQSLAIIFNFTVSVHSIMNFFPINFVV